MRKVLFQKWIPGVFTQEPIDNSSVTQRVCKEGTNCNVEISGLFHGFTQSYNYEGPNNEIAHYPVAIVETEDGSIMQIDPGTMRFLDSTEERQIDWEQRRSDFAKAAMQGILANNHIIGLHDSEGIAFIAGHSVLQADALIAELKKQKP